MTMTEVYIVIIISILIGIIIGLIYIVGEFVVETT